MDQSSSNRPQGGIFEVDTKQSEHASNGDETMNHPQAHRLTVPATNRNDIPSYYYKENGEDSPQEDKSSSSSDDIPMLLPKIFSPYKPKTNNDESSNQISPYVVNERRNIRTPEKTVSIPLQTLPKPAPSAPRAEITRNAIGIAHSTDENGTSPPAIPISYVFRSTRNDAGSSPRSMRESQRRARQEHPRHLATFPPLPPPSSPSPEPSLLQSPPPGTTIPLRPARRSPLLVIVAGFLVLMNTQGLNQAFGVFQTFYMFDLLQLESAATISTIGSAQIALLFVMCVFTSTLASKGRAWLALNAGLGCSAAGLLLCSWGRNFWAIFLTQGLMVGIGIGLLFGAGMELVGLHMPTLSPMGTAIISSGGAVGSVLYTTLSAKVLPLLGYAWTLRLLALINVLTLMLASIILHPKRWLLPIYHEPINWSFRRTYLEPSFMLFASGLLIALMGIYSLFYYDISLSYASSHQPWTKASAILIAFNAGSFPGRFAPLIPAKAVQPATLATLCTLLGAVLLFIGITTSYEGEIVVVVCYGVVIGAIQSLYGDIVTAAAARSKARLSLLFQVSAFGCLSGPPIGGALIRWTASYLAVQLFAGAAVLVGGLLFCGSILLPRQRNVIVV